LSARETCWTHRNDLAERDAVPVDKQVYERMCAQTPSGSGVAKGIG